MPIRRSFRGLLVLSMALTALLGAPGFAAASTAGEVRAGQTLTEQLQAGKTTCARLTTADFEHVGEYVMARMAGSTAQHEALNTRMRAALGAERAEQMHVLMGERYTGCSRSGGGMGPGMMGGAGGEWGSMMNSSHWNWMHDGSWQRMSNADWHRQSDGWGPGIMGDEGHGWWPGAIIGLVALVAAALAAGVWFGWRGARKPRTGDEH